MTAQGNAGSEVNNGGDGSRLDPKHDLGEVFLGEDGHDSCIDECSQGEHSPALAPDGTAIDIGAEKADQEHQPADSEHSAVIHVIRQERGIDVGYLAGRDLCVFQIAVALRVSRAKPIRYPLGELPQVPTVTQFGK